VTSPQLPASLAARLAGATWTRNLVGQAGAHVYRVERDGAPDLYLKHGTGEAAGAVVDEMVRLRWLAGAGVPALEHFECTLDDAWLVTRALPGRTAHEWITEQPARTAAIVRVLAHCLARWHALPAAACPFNADHALRLAHARARIDAGLVEADDFDADHAGWTPDDVWRATTSLLPLDADRVVTHGDFTLDNVLLDADGQVTGVLDLGRVGVADRYQDLAILWRDLGEFGAEPQRELFTAYGIAAPDERKLRFHLCLDEFF
jgi:aminoglycoside 3'-phosphotransferase-1